MRTLPFASLIFLVFLYQEACSQLPDSVVLSNSRKYIQSIHENVVKQTQHLYNGSEYVVVRSIDGEHPYFLSGSPEIGSVFYRGEEFPGTPLLLDLEKEKLIISNPGYGAEMELVSEWVESFTIGSHQFIKVRGQETLEDGFYEELYAGESQVLVKRTKSLSEKLYATNVVRKYDVSNIYFIRYKGSYQRFKTKPELLSILTDKKKELKSFIRKNKLFSRNREYSIVQVAHYFDSLNP